jgi:hypothetical protein
MDALRTLEFSPSSFDLVNPRFGFSWLQTWNWGKLLLEYQRVTRHNSARGSVMTCPSVASRLALEAD